MSKMTQRKLKSLIVQIKLDTPIFEKDEEDLRNYAIDEVLDEADSNTEKKMIAWYLDDTTILDEIRDCINEIWDLRSLGKFLRAFDPRLKKHENRTRTKKSQTKSRG